MKAVQFLALANGSLAMLALVAALFFLRHWRTSHERLFVFFAFAFAGLAANWAALGLWPGLGEHDTYVYGMRLLAFLALILGIVDKNHRSGRG